MSGFLQALACITCTTHARTHIFTVIDVLNIPIGVRVYFMAGLNSPVGGGQKLARFLGTLLVQGHGERMTYGARLVLFSLVIDDNRCWIPYRSICRNTLFAVYRCLLWEKVPWDG